MRAASKLRDRLKESTEQAILQSAEEVFADAGLHAARMETIAQGAGVSVGTLYNYFNDRDSLLRALIDARADQLVDNIRHALLGQENAPIATQLREFVLVFFRHFTDHGRFMSILHQGESEPAHCDVMQKRPSENAVRTIARVRELLREMFEPAIARGELRRELAASLPTFVVAMCKGTAIWHEREHGPGDFSGLAAHADTLVEFFLHGAAVERPA